jgi:hypothetical protein
MTEKAVIPAATVEFVRWDGTNASELQALAGDKFRGTFGTHALIAVGAAGEINHVRPGWYVWKRDDSSESIVSGTEAWLYMRPEIEAE